MEEEEEETLTETRTTRTTIESLERDVEVRDDSQLSLSLSNWKTLFLSFSRSRSLLNADAPLPSLSLSIYIYQAITIERVQILERLSRHSAVASTSANARRKLLLKSSDEDEDAGVASDEEEEEEEKEDNMNNNNIDGFTTTQTTTSTSKARSIRASRMASVLLHHLAKREHLTCASLDIVRKMKEKRKGVFVLASEEEEEAEGEEEEEEESYPLLLDELAKSVALINQASSMARNRDGDDTTIRAFASMSSRVSSHTRKRTLAVAEECRRALTTILRRSLKRTNWPPPLTPSQLSEYEWNVGESESNGVVISRCCELLFVLQTALESDIFISGDNRKDSIDIRVGQYDFVAETFALAVQKRFVKAFASAQHSRAPELMLNCCAKEIEFVPSFVASALIQCNKDEKDNDDAGSNDTTSFLEELFEKRASAFASTIASALSDSARALLEDVYCAKCELDAKKWWLHLADCAIAFDEKCEKDFGRFSNAPKCLDVLADGSEDWKVSWLLSELEASWNEIKPLLDSKDAGWECEASGYAEGSPDDIERDTFNVDVEDDGTLPGVTAPKVSTVLATLLANLVARSEKLSDDEHKVEFLARVPALLVEKFRDAVDDKASEVEHDLFSENMDVVTRAVIRIGACIAASLKIEETLSELSELPFLVDLVRGYKRDDEDEDDNEDDSIEGVFDDECKMFKDLREIWMDRLANVAVGKSCDALDGYRSYASALRFTKCGVGVKNDDDDRENTSPPASPSSQFPTKASHLLLVGLPALRAWLALLHRSLDSRAFQRVWRKICTSVSKRCFSDDIVRYLLEKQKKEMSEEGINQFAIDVDTYVATFVPYSTNRKAVALAIDRRVRDFLSGKV